MSDKGDLEGMLSAAKMLCRGLTVLDIALGGLTVLAPRFLMRLLAPGKETGDVALLRRAGTTWLFFALVQAWAAGDTGNPKALRAVSALRLMDVPADSVWLATGSDFGRFGRSMLFSAPVFNLVAGSFLAYVAGRIEEEAGEGGGRVNAS